MLRSTDATASKASSRRPHQPRPTTRNTTVHHSTRRLFVAVRGGSARIETGLRNLWRPVAKLPLTPITIDVQRLAVVFGRRKRWEDGQVSSLSSNPLICVYELNCQTCQRCSEAIQNRRKHPMRLCPAVKNRCGGSAGWIGSRLSAADMPEYSLPVAYIPRLRRTENS